MLSVKNWSKFQHYPHRKPIWIKLHRDLLDDMEFNQMPLLAQLLLLKVWMIASQSETPGTLSADPAVIAFRVRAEVAETAIQLQCLIDHGFLEGTLTPASRPLATRRQDASNLLEQSREEERRREESSLATLVSTGNSIGSEIPEHHQRQRKVSSRSKSARVAKSVPTNGDSAQTALAVIEPPENWSREACDDWIAKFKGTAPGGRIGKALKPLVKRFGWDVIRAAWRKYLDGDDPQYITPETFASKLALWAAGGPKRGKGAQREERSREALMQWLRNEGAM